MLFAETWIKGQRTESASNKTIGCECEWRIIEIKMGR
jgi:hypothetical protein